MIQLDLNCVSYVNSDLFIYLCNLSATSLLLGLKLLREITIEIRINIHFETSKYQIMKEFDTHAQTHTHSCQ